MGLFNYAVIALMVPLVILSFVSIKYVRSGKSRIMASIFFIIAAAFTFIIPMELTSYPKKASVEWYARETEEAVVLWGGVHPETLQIHVLLHWTGQSHPRYYVLNNFEPSEGEEGQEGQEGPEGQEGQEAQEAQEAQMRLGEELQKAMKEAELSKQQGGSGIVTMKYPFLSPSEREARMSGEGKAEGENDNDGDGGYEQENDSTFWVEPPPPPNPEKNR